MTDTVNCPVTGNDACGFGYCGDGRCYLRDYAVKSASQPVTDAPSLPAQIEAVRRAIETRDHQSEQFEGARYDAEALRAVLVTLQQHERLEAEFKHASDQAALLRDQRDAETFRAQSADAALNAVMHEHKRLEAVVKAARRAKHTHKWKTSKEAVLEGRSIGDLNDLADALAAIDTAAPEPPTDTAPDKPEDAERGLRRDG